MEIINHEYYVSYEIAKLLEKAGFDWKLDVNFVYADIDKEIRFLSYNYVINHYIAPNIKSDCSLINRKKYKCHYLAPTLDVAQRWLRKVKHWEINIMWFPAEPQYIGVSKEHYTWALQMQIKIGLKNEPNTFIYDTIVKKDGEKYATYEEAQEACIKKALEIILEKGE